MKNLIQQTEIKEDLTSIWLLTAGQALAVWCWQRPRNSMSAISYCHGGYWHDFAGLESPYLVQ